MISVRRFNKNPILRPNKEQSWEAEAVFNGCPVMKGSSVYLLYRAVSLPHYHAGTKMRMRISDIGIAKSKDGINFSDRKRFIVPEYDWEKFGCEDPRATNLGGTYYILYTALSNFPFTPSGIKVGVALSDDLETIKEKHLVTPFNAKAAALFPEKINGKVWAVLTANTDLPPAKIALASFQDVTDLWQEKYWGEWYGDLDKHTLPIQRKADDQVEVGAPPLKTEYGWLLIYSHIKNYYSPQRLFGVEAVLLDLDNPAKIVARTFAPFLIPEEYYEQYGAVPNVVFPSGVLLKGANLYIYYGAADLTCCLAITKLNSFVRGMLFEQKNPVKLTRAGENPIINPRKENIWEEKATFNPAAIYLKDKVHLLYRAMSKDNISVFGYAASRDGIHIDEREEKPIYTPRAPFEKNSRAGESSGCEDPRITLLGDKIYMCYTAFDGTNPPRVALTSIALSKFLRKQWEWAEPVIISAPDFDNKDACIFPEKVKDKYLIFHRMGEDIDIAFVDSLDFDGSTWLEERRWMNPRKGYWDSKKVGIAGPPVKISRWWAMLYHGVSEEDGFYRIGAVLLDQKDPTHILGRTNHPIFEPEAYYEKKGEVPNVVFPCGNVILGKKLFIYYGGADRVVGVASIETAKFLAALR